ncbi:hypothetical protein [Mycobacteroides abscessus]|uniref:hypothetical protein n=1 Tax=Mycobacteroides abscessus TaxID=36809 RepID=UPI0010572FF7|nr:hypothetical protein [Mycobacteroides abscessus]
MGTLSPDVEKRLLGAVRRSRQLIIDAKADQRAAVAEALAAGVSAQSVAEELGGFSIPRLSVA